METTRWITLTILLTILAVLLQIAGFVAPMWIWLDIQSFRAGVGLWFTTGCAIKSSCNTTEPNLSFGYSSDDTYAKPQFNAVRGLQTLGLAGGVLLLLFLLVYRAGYRRWSRMGQLNLTAFVTCVLTWLCITAGLIVYCAYYWPVVGTSPLFSPNSFPWSALLCFFAAFLFVAICVLIRLKCRELDELQHCVPTSGDSKMDLNPVTAHGILHRYFSPFHYNENRRNNFAITHQDGLNRRLINAEDRNLTSGDTVALRDRGLENGVGYRYTSAQNGAATQNDIGIRHSFPTAVVTYSTSSQLNANHLQDQATRAHTSGTKTESGYASVINRDQPYQNGGVPHNPNTAQEYVSYARVARAGGANGSTDYANGDVSRGTRDSSLLADNTTDSRFTREGRIIADSNYHEVRTKSTLLQYTTHTQAHHPASLFSVGSSVKPYDPTYIYRPYSEQQLY